MKNLIYVLLLFTGAAAFADEDLGWQAGLGLVTSNIASEQADTPFFPYRRTDNKQVMLIPNLKWQGEQWSFGADGIGWRNTLNNGLEIRSMAGFPSSSLQLSGQQGWFRYGTRFSANYANGVTTTAGITAGPLTYDYTAGWGDREGDLRQKLSLGAPLYINQENDIVVIGSVYLQQENPDFIENDYELVQALDAGDYRHTGLSVFTVLPVGDRVTLVLSGTLQWNDKALTEQLNTLPDIQANTFLLLNYQF